MLHYNTTSERLFVTLSSTGARQKAALDENSFQQILAAAYVVQEHQEELRASIPQPGNLDVLSTVAEIQARIRTADLNVSAAAALIAERLLRMTQAHGVSISLISGGYLDCVAEAGTPATIPGSCVASHSLVATERLKLGAMFDSGDAQTDMRLDVELCRRLGIGSLIAAPVQRFGEIAGLVEVRWQQAHAYEQSELRICRMMAGLTTGTLERSVRIGNARTPDGVSAEQILGAASQVADAPSPEAAGVAELEVPASNTDSKPELQGTELTGIPEGELPQDLLADSTFSAPIKSAPEPSKSAPPSQEPEVHPEYSCRVCGKPLAASESFCGHCSMPRSPIGQSDGLQSKWASLWFMQRAKGALQDAEPSREEIPNPGVTVPMFEGSTPLLEQPSPLTRVLQIRNSPLIHNSAEEDGTSTRDRLFEDLEKPSFLDGVQMVTRRRWRDAVLLACAIVLAIGIVSAWPKSATQLTWFQELTIRLGISHVPARTYVGPPDARVWLDVHTTLYYCKDADLYGKTPDGVFATQHEAQRDGFEPASGAACP